MSLLLILRTSTNKSWTSRGQSFNKITYPFKMFNQCPVCMMRILANPSSQQRQPRTPSWRGTLGSIVTSACGDDERFCGSDRLFSFGLDVKVLPSFLAFPRHRKVRPPTQSGNLYPSCSPSLSLICTKDCKRIRRLINSLRSGFGGGHHWDGILSSLTISIRPCRKIRVQRRHIGGCVQLFPPLLISSILRASGWCRSSAI